MLIFGRIKSFETERTRLQNQVDILKRESGEHARKMTELTEASSSAKREADTAHKNYEEYKEKAKKILWEKDRLIESLRNGGSNEGQSGEEAELAQAM